MLYKPLLYKTSAFLIGGSTVFVTTYCTFMPDHREVSEIQNMILTETYGNYQ